MDGPGHHRNLSDLGLLMKLRIMKYSISQIRSQVNIRALPTGSDRFHDEGYAVGSSCILSRVQDTISSVDCQRDVSVWGRAIPGVSRLVGGDEGRKPDSVPRHTPHSDDVKKLPPVASTNEGVWKIQRRWPRTHHRAPAEKKQGVSIPGGGDMTICRHSIK